MTIGHRLFLAVLLAFLAVASLGVGLIRWRLLDSGSADTTQDEVAQLDLLAAALAAQYRRQRDWTFIPSPSVARRRWLRDAWATVRPSDIRAATDSMGYRIGLLDSARRYLAGAIAHPFLIAFASIDTHERAIVVDGETVGHLILAKPESVDDALAVAFMLQQQERLLILALAGLALGVTAAALLAAHFRRPIMQLVTGARRLGETRFETRLPASRRDELGELGRAFNALAERLEAAERARRQWVADTSHELRTPLSVLRGQLEALQDGVRAATPETVALLLQQVASLSRRVDELDQLARADVGQLRFVLSPLDAWQLLCRTAEGFAEKLRSAALSLTITEPGTHPLVDGDEDRLRQVFTNVLENGVRYTDRGGTIALRGEVSDECIHLIIDDSAPGVAPGVLESLGTRFFRVDALRDRHARGLGLGLAVSRSIIEAHGGRLTFSTSPLGGLRVTVALPLSA